MIMEAAASNSTEKTSSYQLLSEMELSAIRIAPMNIATSRTDDMETLKTCWRRSVPGDCTVNI